MPIDGHVSGLGQVRRREFTMASGEMSSAEFTHFLSTSLSAMASCCRDGATSVSALKNLCVWNKTNGGMERFYRSKHDLVFVYKVGVATHINSLELGQTGRHCANVLDDACISSLAQGDETAVADGAYCDNDPPCSHHAMCRHGRLDRVIWLRRRDHRPKPH